MNITERNMAIFKAFFNFSWVKPMHELVYVSGGRQRQNRALANGLQRVPSAQRTNIPHTGRICPKSGSRSRLNIDFFSFSLDYSLGDTSNIDFFLIQSGLLFGGHLKSLICIHCFWPINRGQIIIYNKKMSIIKLRCDCSPHSARSSSISPYCSHSARKFPDSSRVHQAGESG